MASITRQGSKSDARKKAPSDETLDKNSVPNPTPTQSANPDTVPLLSGQPNSPILISEYDVTQDMLITPISSSQPTQDRTQELETEPPA